MLREQLLCTNRAAQWPVTEMQLTASLLQRGNRGHQISALHANSPHVHLERHYWAGPRQFAAQLDSLGRMELNLQASAFNTQSINHLWQPSVHTQMGLLGEDCSLSPLKQQLNQTHSVFFTLTVVGMTERQRPAWCDKQGIICAESKVWTECYILHFTIFKRNCFAIYLLAWT